MVMSNLCDYFDVYILVKGTIIIAVVRAAVAGRQAEERNKQETFKNCTSFTDCISKTNNNQVDDAKDLDIVMPMHNHVSTKIIVQKH